MFSFHYLNLFTVCQLYVLRSVTFSPRAVLMLTWLQILCQVNPSDVLGPPRKGRKAGTDFTFYTFQGLHLGILCYFSDGKNNTDSESTISKAFLLSAFCFHGSRSPIAIPFQSRTHGFIFLEWFETRENMLFYHLMLRLLFTVILGDTSDSRSLLVAARGADVLVHEATVIEQEADLAAHRGHSTACTSSSSINPSIFRLETTLNPEPLSL